MSGEIAEENSQEGQGRQLQTIPNCTPLIQRAIEEDLSIGDPTTESLIPPDLCGSAVIQAKSFGIVCGGPIAEAVFNAIDPDIDFVLIMSDGSRIHPGQVIAQITGSVAGIVKAERTALNFLQHLSGIATQTDLYVQAVEGLPVRIVDTRKTIPGLRTIEKYAVRTGGGHNHRRNLGDGILIKDNHILALKSQGLDLRAIIDTAKRNSSHTLKIEVEVENVADAEQALGSGAELLLLDNMSLEDMRTVVGLSQGKALVEASGGIDLESVRAVAECGVDIISIGALTHSAKALDISLDLAI